MKRILIPSLLLMLMTFSLSAQNTQGHQGRFNGQIPVTIQPQMHMVVQSNLQSNIVIVKPQVVTPVAQPYMPVINAPRQSAIVVPFYQYSNYRAIPQYPYIFPVIRYAQIVNPIQTVKVSMPKPWN